jgi:predicted amidophosphoribosyltransferase
MGSLAAVLGDAGRCCSCGVPGPRLCVRCRDCAARPLADQPVPGVARIIAPWAYEAGPRSLVLDLKLRNRQAAATPLVAEMTTALRRAGTTATAITWVPCRRADIKRRGFDHAHVLARGIAGATGLALEDLLTRMGHQQDQAGLGRAARLANLRHAFRATPCSGTVLLVDDLVTTGATAAACAAALRGAGARRVELVVACRA